jgi:lipopolysaccharide/colanic/teichoic acid biosynthesis glycosyltransferase
MAAVLLTMPGWLVVGYPVAVLVARLLRSTHLDDLPQLLNEIRGQMSLVGSRPERPHFALLKS